MNNQENQKGFSLIELLIVVVVIGIIAAIAVPALQKARAAAENSTTVSTMRTINSAEASFYSQKGRFGRLTEIQAMMNNGLGATAGDRIVRGQYTFEMTPLIPTDLELKDQFTITATRGGATEVYKYELSQSGVIVQILPVSTVTLGN